MAVVWLTASLEVLDAEEVWLGSGVLDEVEALLVSATWDGPGQYASGVEKLFTRVREKRSARMTVRNRSQETESTLNM